ncbi:hypothetical protein ADH67_11765 [Turicimonas muris]|uniref:Uncharacterized protein n=1 Tax=Turicimonas muris TaxID=1796652 RepID=A0A227KAY6_9BURK|nr:hypothetical protein ADH67_11765 [Turicimonas muris]
MDLLSSFNNWLQTFLYEISSGLDLTDFFVGLRDDMNFFSYYLDEILDTIKTLARIFTSGILF